MAGPRILRKEPNFEVEVAPPPRPTSLGAPSLGSSAMGATPDGTTPMERMYFAWNDALARNDPAALLSLYAEDAVLESPLVPHLLKQKSGVLRGRRELKPLFDMLALRKPRVRQYHRSGYLTDGKRMIFEYPREGGKGEQMDFAEVMELNEEGLIQRHCVYWGWYGFGVLQRDEYRQ